jgi:hypothetical protein
LPRLLQARPAGTAAVVADRILVVDGQADGKLLTTTEAFDGSVWREVATMLTPRAPAGLRRKPALHSIPPRFARRERQLRLCSRCGDEVGREMIIMEGDGGRHDAVAVAGHAVEASTRDFGDQPVAAQLDDEA